MFKVAVNYLSSFVTKAGSHKRICCMCFLAGFVVVFVYHSYYGKKKRIKSVRKLTEVIFFMDDDGYRNYQRSRSGLENLKKLVNYLDSAKVSLDVCVFTITSHQLGEVILKKFREGVRIRIITDESMAGDGSQIPKFRRDGIMVRVRPSQSLMHHKFAIVDNELLINGSFNWTEQATFGNWENVIVTTVPVELVKPYVDHFESLWIKLNTDS